MSAFVHGLPQVRWESVWKNVQVTQTAMKTYVALMVAVTPANHQVECRRYFHVGKKSERRYM